MTAWVGEGAGVGVAATVWVGVGLGVGVAATAGVGVGLEVGVAAAAGVGVGEGDGVIVPTGGVGLPPEPGMNEKSSARDDEIHGCCSRLDARVTPTLVLLSVSSAIWSGTRISLSSSCTNRL